MRILYEVAGLVRVPKVIALSITVAQIVQMLLGCMIIGAVAFVSLIKQRPCAQSLTNVALGACIYGSYLVLFTQFFLSTYLKKSGKHSIVTSSDVRPDAAGKKTQ